MNTLQEGKKRDSTYELLRVIAILSIISYHIWNGTIRPSLLKTMREGELFNSPVFYAKLLIPEALTYFAVACNNQFLLISGFFMAGTGKRFRLDRKIGELMKQMGFAVTLLILVSAVIVRIRPDFGVQPVIILDYNNEFWFPGYYISVIILADLFLNRFLEGLDREAYGSFVMILLAVISLSWISGLANGFSGNLVTFAVGVFLFSLGGYLRKFDPFRNVRASALVLVMLAVYVLGFLSYHTQTVAAIQADPSVPFIQILPSQTYGSIHMIVHTVALFELFRRLHVPNSRTINFMGKAVFMVYVLHENRLAWNIWRQKDWVQLLYDRPIAFCLQLLVWTLCAFGVCLLSYAFYLGVVRLCGRFKRFVLRGEAE